MQECENKDPDPDKPLIKQKGSFRQIKTEMHETGILKKGKMLKEKEVEAPPSKNK